MQIPESTYVTEGQPVRVCEGDDSILKLDTNLAAVVGADI